MNVIRYPEKGSWKRIIQRSISEESMLEEVVKVILDTVKKQGDQALLSYTAKLDNVFLKNLQVSEEELKAVFIEKKLEEAISLAKCNIEKFHRQQLIDEPVVETSPGVKCWRKNIAIEKVGLYVPGGSAPLFSTVLMLGIPAQLAACKEVVLCTPPGRDGKIDPAILFAAKMVGINTIFKVGGAQAIAAMGYGTASVPRVDKIFGPGNQFVTKAKELIQLKGIAIDLPAGPSEVLIIADESCKPAFVAADLLSQAEHGEDSQVVLLSNNAQVVNEVQAALIEQLAVLPRKGIAERALQNSFGVLLENLDECIAFSNLYAPEHLIIVTEQNQELIDKVTNAGSVFVGNYSCESAGDYASGTNHTLPTNGNAVNYSGVIDG